MARSIIWNFADRMRCRPVWLEDAGDRQILVRGYSPLDNLIYGAIGAGLILLPIIALLVSLP